jgi:hypothetical protein
MSEWPANSRTSCMIAPLRMASRVRQVDVPGFDLQTLLRSAARLPRSRKKVKKLSIRHAGQYGFPFGIGNHPLAFAATRLLEVGKRRTVDQSHFFAPSHATLNRSGVVPLSAARNVVEGVDPFLDMDGLQLRQREVGKSPDPKLKTGAINS